MNATDKKTLRRIVANLSNELTLTEDVRRRWHSQVDAKSHWKVQEIEAGCLDGIAANLEAAIVELSDLLK